MKLLLHGLRWDLRRFRWPLLIWTALLAGFVCYLGWLHLNLLTIDPRILQYNEAAGAVLGIIEFFLLLLILSTDPAAGVRPFWKTRPPAGFAVAGAKAAIAILFFLALPLLLQWLMYQWCNLGEPEPRWGGKSWPWMLWWTQCLAVGAILLAASGARGAGQALGFLAAGAALLAMTSVLIQRFAVRESLDISFRTSAFENGVIHAGNVTLWLLAGVLFFSWMRRTRTPSRLCWAVPCVVPTVALIAAVGLANEGPPRNLGPETNLRELPVATASALKIGEPAFLDGVNINHWTVGHAPVVAFQLRLRLEGLPSDHLAHAEWRNLKLIFEDGREFPLPVERLQTVPWREPNRDRLPVATFSLNEDEIAPYSLQPCRAEGTLKVSLEQLSEAEVAKKPGAVTEGGNHRLFTMRAAGFEHGRTDELAFELAVSSRPNTGIMGAAFFLEDPLEPECRLSLARKEGRRGSGYFMESSRYDWTLHKSTIHQPVAAGRMRRAAERGALSAWRLMAARYEPVGFTEVQVKLNHLFIPQLSLEGRKPEEILSGLRLRPGMPSAKVERLVRFALKLPSLTATKPQGTVVIPRPSQDHPFIGALTRFLESIPPSHLPALLEIAERDQPSDSSMEPPWGHVFRRHLATMLAEGTAQALEQSHPQAFEYLAYDLAQIGLIPMERSRQTSTQRLSDAELLREWKSPRGKYATAYFLRPEPLVEAFRRGLSWAAAELSELAQLAPNEMSPSDLLPAISKLSDCPGDPHAAIPWLQQNAARLTWDADAKRWVLPPNP